MPIKIVTINILDDLSRWQARRDLLANGLAALNPDLVAVQEVRLPQNPARWLAEQIGLPYISLTPKMGFESSKEAIAILSRFPFVSEGMLDLKGQQRVAQYVQVEVSNQPWIIANGHFYWQPGESPTRLRQVELFLDWLKSFPENFYHVACGDFNSTPVEAPIQRMREHFVSTYAQVHGREPDYTCPTALPRSYRSQLRTILGFFVLIRPKKFNLNWHGTLDYIFTDPQIKVLDCQVILNHPRPDNPKIYPSDHFGLCATLETSV